MKLLIANEVDPMLSWVDWRTYSQRLLWFAEDGDVLVLPGQPDEAFLRHVTELTGTDPDTLAVLVPPSGRYRGKVVDPYSLLDEEFTTGLAKALADREVTELLSCWPSPVLPMLAERLGLRHLVGGADFLEQSGGDLANSKATFRALAAAAGVPIMPGAVCYTAYEAQQALPRLLDGTGAVLVKQSHNGAGAGNQLVMRDTSHATGHVGAKLLHQLAPGPDGVRAYLDEHWDWASQQGHYPVVIEEFKPAARTVYAEFVAEDDRVRHTATGELGYAERRLVRESTPAHRLEPQLCERLLAAAARLAEQYRALGYRGHLSADAIVDRAGDFAFTELNARVTGSLHLYGPIATRVARAHDEPRRTVTQHRTPAAWPPMDLPGFLAVAEQAGVRFDPHRRSGVLIAMPPMPGVRGGFDFCIVHGSAAEEQAVLFALDRQLRPA
ncbi:hypothetical protein ACFW1A_31750 [Kitasatospora sp. NPDC058965]|uniref:preATP grasp domain-containing protein n=1 Tax=Kitasatospora sp. NPDC058965 TaxID=3346682 RepID=UPI00368F7C91